VTRAATPEAATTETYGVYRKTLTQKALGIHNIYEMSQHNTRAKVDQELDYSTGS
jgi:hypothetical protein